MREPLVSKVLKALLMIAFALGALGAVTLPFMLDSYMHIFYDAYSLAAGYRTFLIVFLMVVAGIGLWLLLEMIGMLRTIPSGPFILRNVHALRRVGVGLLCLSALFFGKCLYYVTFLTMAVGILFILCGLFAFTLGNLIGQAVVFKEENDLTI